MKLLAFEISELQREYFQSHLPESLPQEYYPGILKIEDLNRPEDVTHLVVFVYSQVTAEVMEELPNLKAIFTMSTGYDHIDVAAAKSRGITVHSVPVYGEHTIAEHTFALILALSRKIIESVERTRDYNFTYAGLEGSDLEGKTLGIIGMGKIGSHVARMATGFSMNILAYDPFPKPELATEIGFSYSTLEELLPQSDIITLHTAYRPETHHIINHESIELFKKGSYLINTARGGLVKTSAIIKGLEDGILAGAGLDVLEGEQLVIGEENFPRNTVGLIKDPRVIVTPHNAFHSDGALQRMLETTVTSIKSQLEGNLVNQVQ